MLMVPNCSILSIAYTMAKPHQLGQPMHSPPARLVVPPREPIGQVVRSLSVSLGSLSDYSISSLIFYTCLCKTWNTLLILERKSTTLARGDSEEKHCCFDIFLGSR